MPRICVIVPGMPAEEAEWFLPYFVTYLRRLHKHVDLHVYALKHPGKRASYHIHGIPVTSFNSGWIKLQSRLMNAVLSDHQETPFTHVHAIWANTAGFFGAMVARNLKLPFVVTMGGEELVNMPPIKYGAMRKWRTKPILRYVLKSADAINAPSSGTAIKLMHNWGVAADKIHSIPFGVDTDTFEPIDTPLKGPLHLLAVGGLIPVKRHSLLIKAFAKIRESIPDAQLTIVGEGPLRNKLEQMAGNMGVSEALWFPGWIHHEQMPEVYRTAHIAAITSYHEEIPVTLLEALASGLHVVSVNTGIAYDLHEQSRFPLSITEADPEEFAQSIIKVWQNHTSIVSQLPEKSECILSVDTTVSKMLDLFSAT